MPPPRDHDAFPRERKTVAHVACGALVISDATGDLERKFGGAAVTYETREELHALVERFLADPAERAARGEAGRRVVLEQHTFARRADVLLEAVEAGMAR